MIERPRERKINGEIDRKKESKNLDVSSDSLAQLQVTFELKMMLPQLNVFIFPGLTKTGEGNNFEKLDRYR